MRVYTHNLVMRFQYCDSFLTIVPCLREQWWTLYKNPIIWDKQMYKSKVATYVYKTKIKLNHLNKNIKQKKSLSGFCNQVEQFFFFYLNRMFPVTSNFYKRKEKCNKNTFFIQNWKFSFRRNFFVWKKMFSKS